MAYIPNTTKKGSGKPIGSRETSGKPSGGQQGFNPYNVSGTVTGDNLSGWLWDSTGGAAGTQPGTTWTRNMRDGLVMNPPADPKARNDGLPGTTGGVAGGVGYGFTPDQYSQKGGRYGKPDRSGGAVNNDDLLFMNPPAMQQGGGTHPFDWFANNDTPMGGGTSGTWGDAPPTNANGDVVVGFDMNGNPIYGNPNDPMYGPNMPTVVDTGPVSVGDIYGGANPSVWDNILGMSYEDGSAWWDSMRGSFSDGDMSYDDFLAQIQGYAGGGQGGTADVENPYPRTRYSGNGYYMGGMDSRNYDYQRNSTGNIYGFGGGRGSGGFAGESSIGGVSAVNPQADMDLQGYIDQTYGALQNRLDPIFDQQRDAFDQSMVNRGIPIGSEAYNEALRQMDQNRSDAYTQAGMQALGFGADLQNQMFGQDATRSSLANALLRSRWNTDLGYSQLGESARQFDNSLMENMRQFDDTLGFRYAGLGEDARQFDDRMDFGYFNADRDDMRWLLGYERDIWNDQINNERWSDQLASGLITPWMPGQTNVNPFVAGYGYGMDGWNMGMNAQGDYWNALLAALERTGIGG